MSEYYAVQRSTDHLAHYGVRGMKWGVRKAVILGNQKKLDKHFRKAAKKLAKLSDKALNSKKYAAKAAAYGAAAAGIGTLAVGGTGMVSKGMKSAGKAMETVGRGMFDSRKHTRLASVLTKIGSETSKAGSAVEEWGKQPKVKHPTGNVHVNSIGSFDKPAMAKKQSTPMSNNTKFRIGAGVASVGLAGLAVKNAYTAANSKKYISKANSFKRSMDEAFAGTKYANKYVAIPKQKKRKRR